MTQINWTSFFMGSSLGSEWAPVPTVPTLSTSTCVRPRCLTSSTELLPDPTPERKLNLDFSRPIRNRKKRWKMQNKGNTESKMVVKWWQIAFHGFSIIDKVRTHVRHIRVFSASSLGSCLWWSTRSRDLIWVFCWNVPNMLRDQKTWPMHSTYILCQIHRLLGFPQWSGSKNSMKTSSAVLTVVHPASPNLRDIYRDRSLLQKCFEVGTNQAAGAPNTWHTCQSIGKCLLPNLHLKQWPTKAATVRGCGSAMLPPRGPQGWVAITAIGLVREKWTWWQRDIHHRNQHMEWFCPMFVTMCAFQSGVVWCVDHWSG